MRDEKSLVTFIIIACLISTLLRCSNSETSNPHFKRGMEWMDIKGYDNARLEFLQVIEQEPKNVEARYQIALSCRFQENLHSAIDWCIETLSIAPNHAKTRKLVKDISELTEKLLLSPDERSQIKGLALLGELIEHRFVSTQPILEQKVIPLLKSASRKVANQTFALLKREGVDVEGLSNLAKDNDPEQRWKALNFIRTNIDKRYLPVLHILTKDKSEPIKEEAALLLMNRFGDDTAKSILAEIYHAHLQKEIARGRGDKGIGVQFDKRVKKIATLAPKLGDPSFAGELAELLCVGKVYGILATDLINSMKKIGKPAVPYLREVLNREIEFRRLLRQKGFRPDQIDWRFRYIRNVITTLDR